MLIRLWYPDNCCLDNCYASTTTFTHIPAGATQAVPSPSHREKDLPLADSHESTLQTVDELSILYNMPQTIVNINPKFVIVVLLAK